MLDTDHLHRITRDAAVLAGEGVDRLAPETLCAVAVTARRLRELADHLEVHALGALDPTGHTENATALSAGAWFAREAKLPSAVGRTQVTMARALRHLPGTDQAWLDGRITSEHVRVLAAAANPRIRDQIAKLEPELIGIAEDRTFHHWRLRVAEVVTRLDTEGPDPDDPTHSTASWGRSGLFAELRAKFAGADVELLEQIIEARTNALYRTNVEEHKQTSDLPLLSRSQLRALAIIDLILHGHDTDLAHHEHDDDEHDHDEDEADRDDEAGHVHDERGHTDGDHEMDRDDEPEHDMHDTRDDEPAGEAGSDLDHEADDETARLIDDVRDDEASRELEFGTAVTAPISPTAASGERKHTNHQRRRKRRRRKSRNPLRVGVTLVLKPGARAPNPDGARPLRPDRDPTWTLTNLDGRDLPLDRFASLLCDADLEALLVDADDNPLNLGRQKRIASPEQRRAVLIRDGGCAMPGCDCPAAWVEIHHVKLWSDGGTTDIVILAGLCRRHHGITHRTGWSMHATADGWFWWRTPSGHTFWSQRHGIQRAGPTPPLSADIAS